MEEKGHSFSIDFSNYSDDLQCFDFEVILHILSIYLKKKGTRIIWQE